MQEAVKPGLSGPVVTPRVRDSDVEQAREFGGTFGAALIMTLSHALMLYLWVAWRFYDGAVFYPAGLADVGPFFARSWEQIVVHATPTWGTFAVYWTFLIIEGLMAAYLHGLKIKGLPIASRGGQRLVYRCNGISA